jgi:hypothetical protein
MFTGFTRLPEWDFETSRGRYPLLLHALYFDLYRHQVIKQAGLVAVGLARHSRVPLIIVP